VMRPWGESWECRDMLRLYCWHISERMWLINSFWKWYDQIVGIGFFWDRRPFVLSNSIYVEWHWTKSNPDVVSGVDAGVLASFKTRQSQGAYLKSSTVKSKTIQTRWGFQKISMETNNTKPHPNRWAPGWLLHGALVRKWWSTSQQMWDV
jgi:hypothetical protein